VPGPGKSRRQHYRCEDAGDVRREGLHDASIARALRRMRAFSDALRAWRMRASAARAWPLSGIGYARRSGTAKVEVRSPRRAFAVNLAI
jgi:hypothetical protein